MQYEIYIDSVFFLGFLLNLYSLFVLNNGLNHTAGWKRLLLGAGIGGGGCCLIFLQPFLTIRGITVILVSVLELWLTFHPPSKELFIKLAKQMLILNFLFGGLLYYILYHTPLGGMIKTSLFFILFVGFGLTILGRNLFRQSKEREDITYDILLQNEGREKMTVIGFLDTGNGLYEPISGKPVSVMDKACFEKLFDSKVPYRAIPFRSMGCKSGIMKGYLLDKMIIHTKEESITLKQVYVGVDEENILSEKGCRIIIHPDLLKEKERENGRSRSFRENICKKNSL
ncbi:MAG: sigma-E processing peptidase SpoIIGA [Lachnospiraceae bacterium]